MFIVWSFIFVIAFSSMVGGAIGSAIVMLLMNKSTAKSAEQGIQNYLDRKEEELNSKVKRKSF